MVSTAKTNGSATYQGAQATHASAGSPVKHSQVASRDSSLGEHQVFFFFSRRWRQGLVNALTSGGLALGGTILLLQLGEPANLVVQMSILGLCLWAAAIYFICKAAGDLGGFLRLDAEGVHLRQRLATRSIAWDDVKSWSVSGEARPFEISRVLQVNQTKTEPPLVIHCENFRPDAIPILQRTLLNFAPLK